MQHWEGKHTEGSAKYENEVINISNFFIGNILQNDLINIVRSATVIIYIKYSPPPLPHHLLQMILIVNIYVIY